MRDIVFEILPPGGIDFEVLGPDELCMDISASPVEHRDRPPYISLERLGSYLYRVTFDTIPAFAGGDGSFTGGCSSFVQNGKLYRNLDWDYSELASFHLVCSGFEGMAFSPGLTDTELDDDLIGQLPYRLVDGCNDYGIRVSTHVLYNDWDWEGSGDTPLYKIPHIILSQIQTLDNLSTQLGDILGDLYATPTLTAADYLLQFVVTDGTTTYAILPPQSVSGAYVVQDITANPKLANFRWVSSPTVQRTELQTRPTGVERFNMMPCPLADLRFTKAYETPDRLSEFIGLRGTDKDSTDAELEEIYDTAHALYERRTRDGSTWQTMHSVVYDSEGPMHLWVQEDWAEDYIGRADPYEGPYEVTPDFDTQTLETAQKLMLDDVTIEPIPPNLIDTSDADAIAAHIKKGDIAYVDGVRITGEAELKYIAETEELILPDWMVILE